eukprot:181602-Chlamydomonas_euryale.AAC.2
MVLELRATRPASGKAAGATAGAAGDDDEPGGDASDGQASDGAPASSAKRRGRAPAKPAKSAKAAAATAAAGAVADREKEQISKVVKVQVGSEWLPRSLAQVRILRSAPHAPLPVLIGCLLAVCAERLPAPYASARPMLRRRSGIGMEAMRAPTHQALCPWAACVARIVLRAAEHPNVLFLLVHCG